MDPKALEGIQNFQNMLMTLRHFYQQQNFPELSQPLNFRNLTQQQMMSIPSHLLPLSSQHFQNLTPQQIQNLLIKSSTPLTLDVLNSTMNPPLDPSITPIRPIKAPRQKRPSMPTKRKATVWQYFTAMDPPYQAASCDLCKKEIKATNSSTTGMIRHLKSMHKPEYGIYEHNRCHPKSESLRGESFAKELNDSSKSISDDSLISPNSTASSANATVASSSGVLKVANIPSDSAFDSMSEDINSVCDSTAPSDFILSFDFPKTLLQKNEENKLLYGTVKEELVAEKKVEQHEEVKENKPVVDVKQLPCNIDQFTLQIAMMLINDKLAASVVESQLIRSLVHMINPNYKIPSASEFENDIIPRLNAAGYAQQFMANNRSVNGWPNSPSSTIESGYEDVENNSEASCSTSQKNFYDQSRKKPEGSTTVNPFRLNPD